MERFQEIYNELTGIFQDFFDDDTIQVCETTSPTDIEDWDSLAHIRLIVIIEKHFGKKFTMDEVVQMKTGKAIAEKVID